MTYRRKKSVKMCVCHRHSFSELKEIAEEKKIQNAGELMDRGYYGSGCGMCRPYVHKMMVTGETEFYPGDIYIESETNTENR